MNKISFVLLGLVIFAAGCRGSLPLGAHCASDRQCGGRMICDATGVCAKGSCSAMGGHCRTNDDCCGTMYCSGKTCH